MSKMFCLRKQRFAHGTVAIGNLILFYYDKDGLYEFRFYLQSE